MQSFKGSSEMAMPKSKSTPDLRPHEQVLDNVQQNSDRSMADLTHEEFVELKLIDQEKKLQNIQKNLKSLFVYLLRKLEEPEVEDNNDQLETKPPFGMFS